MAGAPDMRRKRWLCGSCSASRSMPRTAVTSEWVPHCVTMRSLASLPCSTLQYRGRGPSMPLQQSNGGGDTEPGMQEGDPNPSGQAQLVVFISIFLGSHRPPAVSIGGCVVWRRVHIDAEQVLLLIQRSPVAAAAATSSLGAHRLHLVHLFRGAPQACQLQQPCGD